MAEMEICKAIFSFRSKKPNFYASAFHYKLLFGPLSSDGQTYEELKCFEIEYCDYHQLYIGFFPILKCLSGKTDVKEGNFLNKNCLYYKWKVSEASEPKTEASEPKIILYISKDISEDTTDITNKFSIAFSLNEFNDLLYLITELCFISLDLSIENLTIFHTFSNFELSKLLTFQKKDTLKTQLHLMKNDLNLSELKLHCTCELVFYNLDVIICIHKLRLFYNDKKFLTRLNITAMQECESS